MVVDVFLSIDPIKRRRWPQAEKEQLVAASLSR
jgi:hypothetical protein